MFFNKEDRFRYSNDVKGLFEELESRALQLKGEKVFPTSQWKQI